MQNSTDAFQSWSDDWLLKLNVNKCKVPSVRREPDESHVYSICANNNNKQLERETSITDLGVILDKKLTFSEHIQSKIHKAYSMIGVLKRNFKYISVSGYVMLYKCMIRSHLDYCSSVWAPFKRRTLMI